MRCTVPSSLLRLVSSSWSFKIPLQFSLIVPLSLLWTSHPVAIQSSMILYVHTMLMENWRSVCLNNTFSLFPIQWLALKQEAMRWFGHLYSSCSVWCEVSHGQSVHVFAKKGRKLVFSNRCYFSGKISWQEKPCQESKGPVNLEKLPWGQISLGVGERQSCSWFSTAMRAVATQGVFSEGVSASLSPSCITLCHLSDPFGLPDLKVKSSFYLCSRIHKGIGHTACSWICRYSLQHYNKGPNVKTMKHKL